MGARGLRGGDSGGFEAVKEGGGRERSEGRGLGEEAAPPGQMVVCECHDLGRNRCCKSGLKRSHNGEALEEIDPALGSFHAPAASHRTPECQRNPVEQAFTDHTTNSE